MPRKKEMGRQANGLGNIRKKTVNRNGKSYTYWEARCTTGYDLGSGRQKQHSISGKTQKEVAQKLKQIAAEVDSGTYQAPSRMALREWLETWQQEYLGDVKASTAYLYGCNIDQYILPHLGAVKLEALTAPMIQRLYNTLLSPDREGVKPLSPKTIRNVHGVLHKALQQAVQVGYIRSNPADACKPPKVEKKEMHPMDEAQIALFLKAVQGHPYEYLYKIALFTGMREGELLGLTWDCVDLDNGMVVVKQQLQKERQKGGQYYISSPKNGKRRVLSLAPSVVHLFRLQKAQQAALRMQAGDSWEENNLVFTRSNGSCFSSRTAYNSFKRVVEAIGVPGFRFHDLRHSYAVASIQSGDDIKTVQENLGHATAAFTLDVYAHVTAQMKQESARRMERFIQSVSS